MSKPFSHIPVLLQEVQEGLHLQPNSHCLDGTVGLGGHARMLLEATAPDGIVVGMDRDQETLRVAAENLRTFGDRCILLHDSYAKAGEHEEVRRLRSFHAILLDLGISSVQLDDPEKGFSFRSSGALDMRFDRTAGKTAADLLNSQSEEELRTLFRDYGEEPRAGALARAIVQDRKNEPFSSIPQFVGLVERVISRRGKIHPATRVFQALRIAVNDELQQLKDFLPLAVDLLGSGGRLAIISFHSLEDRIVKQFFRDAINNCVCPPAFPECRCDHRATLIPITKKPILPTEEEVSQNSRARSAKLRIAQKI